MEHSDCTRQVQMILLVITTMQVKALDFPKTTASYRKYQVEQIAADIKETILRVSDGPFDADQNTSIPTVNYEVSIFALGSLSESLTVVSCSLLCHVCCSPCVLKMSEALILCRAGAAAGWHRNPGGSRPVQSPRSAVQSGKCSIYTQWTPLAHWSMHPDLASPDVCCMGCLERLMAMC